MSIDRDLEKRDTVLYVRVRPAVKAWVEKTAKRTKTSESRVVDAIISREMSREKGRKSANRSPK